MLRQLEYLEEDQQRSILDMIYRNNDVSLEESRRCWEVISSNGWYENICRTKEFRFEDLAAIFTAVIASLAEQPSVEGIAKWARHAPPPMVGGLLAAAKMTDAEIWNWLMELLEPTLAYRWTKEHLMVDYWNDRRVVRSYAGFERDEGNRGKFGLRRRSGRKL